MSNHLIKEILRLIGEEPERKELKLTPERVIESYKYIFSGYGKNYNDVIGNTFIKGENNDIILFNNLAFLSTCEHHLLPFYGNIKIAYIPGVNLISLGKISDLVMAVTRKLQIQERIAEELAVSLQESALSPKGVFISLKARHFCTCASGASIPATLENIYTTQDFKISENLFKLSLLEK